MTAFNGLLSVTLVNCLHYAVTLVDEDGNKIRTLLPSDKPIMVKERRKHGKRDFPNIGHVPVVTIESRANYLPPPRADGVAYIVPLRALQLWATEGFDTDDLYAPFDLVRDSSGNVIGCKSLMQIGDVE